MAVLLWHFTKETCGTIQVWNMAVLCGILVKVRFNSSLEHVYWSEIRADKISGMKSSINAEQDTALIFLQHHHRKMHCFFLHQQL